MHGLLSREAADLLGVSSQTVSAWLNQRSRPNFEGGLKIAEIFEIRVDRLVNESFGDLLDVLGDKERYGRVEARIQNHREGSSA